MSEPIPISIDDDRTILIYGIRYAMGIFQMIGIGPVGSIIRIAKREGEVVTFESIQDFRPSRDRAIELLRKYPNGDWWAKVKQFLKDIDAGGPGS